MLHCPSSLALLIELQDRACLFISLIHAVSEELVIFVHELGHGVVEQSFLVVRIYQRFRHLATRRIAARD